MSRKALRFQYDLFNRPHLCTSSTLDNVLSYLNSRNSGEFELSASKQSFNTSTSEVEFDSATKTGTLRVMGPMSYRSTILTSLCGLTSYQKVESDFRKLISLQAKKVILWIDSGGGESYSCLETAAILRSLADKNGIRLIAYCDGVMASAAYAIGCVSHEVILNPESQTGSIGVVVKLRNFSKGLKQAGIEDTYLFAGKNKIAFDGSGEWSQEFIADLKIKIDSLYNEFTSFVAKYRKLNVKNVIATNAKMFTSADAIKIGLADKAMTREQFSNYLMSGTATQSPITVKAKAPVTSIAPKAQAVKSTDTRLLTPAQKWRGVVDSPKTKTTVSPALTTEQRLKRISKSFSQPYEVETVFKETKNLNDKQFEAKLSQLERDLGLNKTNG